jgi:putative endonuclease
MRLIRCSSTLTSRIYHIYLVECADGTLYCGVTTDVERRLNEHNTGRRGAKYTRSRRPVHLLVSHPVCCLSCSLKTERVVKSLPRRRKLELIADKEKLEQACKTCDHRLLLIHEAAQWTSSKQKEKETNEHP